MHRSQVDRDHFAAGFVTHVFLLALRHLNLEHPLPVT
jgi:hypothetical protein